MKARGCSGIIAFDFSPVLYRKNTINKRQSVQKRSRSRYWSDIQLDNALTFLFIGE